jgi:hypothetical protein
MSGDKNERFIYKWLLIWDMATNRANPALLSTETDLQKNLFDLYVSTALELESRVLEESDSRFMDVDGKRLDKLYSSLSDTAYALTHTVRQNVAAIKNSDEGDKARKLLEYSNLLVSGSKTLSPSSDQDGDSKMVFDLIYDKFGEFFANHIKDMIVPAMQDTGQESVLDELIGDLNITKNHVSISVDDLSKSVSLPYIKSLAMVYVGEDANICVEPDAYSTWNLGWEMSGLSANPHMALIVNSNCGPIYIEYRLINDRYEDPKWEEIRDSEFTPREGEQIWEPVYVGRLHRAGLSFKEQKSEDSWQLSYFRVNARVTDNIEPDTLVIPEEAYQSALSKISNHVPFTANMQESTSFRITMTPKEFLQSKQ